jgi:hypothetical protein
MGKICPYRSQADLYLIDLYLLFFIHTFFQEEKLLYLIYKNTFSSLSRASLIRSIDVA